MASTQLPDGNAFARRFMTIASTVGIGSAAVLLVLIVALLRMPREQHVAFWISLFAVALLSTPVFHAIQQKGIRPLRDCLDALARGAADEATIHAGFRAAVDLPRRLFVIQFVNYPIACLLVTIVLMLWFPSFEIRNAVIIVGSGTTGGVFGTMVISYVIKRWLEDIRHHLAGLIADPDVRASLVIPFTLSQKLVTALVSIAVIPSLFVFMLAQTQTRDEARALAASEHRAVLELATEAIRTQGTPGLFSIEAEAALWDVHAHLLIVNTNADPDSAEFVVAGDGTLLKPVERALLAETNLESGDGEALHSANVFHWQRLSEGQLIVAVTPAATVLAGRQGLMGVILLVFVAVVFAVSIAWMMAKDMSRSAGLLCSEAERVASGDLSHETFLESEDEFGELSRVFSRMTRDLRQTASALASTARRVESTTEMVDQLTKEVAGTAREQVHGVGLVTASMGRISGQVEGITTSARSLNVLAEESSSSTLELAAASEQMRETAEVLASRVESVSSAIDQMSASAGEVTHSAETLTTTADDTSASMEEMASAMKQVDVAAEETAAISARMLSAARTGQERVGQTARGMDSIREATSAAEGVIRSLGERTREIGSILQVIDDIADQTNLLALNAAIIAAQAGEHGRPFSVVGGEIKKLADRVLTKTKEIGALIHAVQEESTAAVGAIETGTRSVAEGVELSRQASSSLDEILEAVSQSGDRIQQIVSAVREQTRAAAHVAEMMETVRSGVDHIRSATGEQKRGNDAMRESATIMREVSQQMRNTTDEQARGANQIRTSVEGVRDAVEEIQRALATQSESCAEVEHLLEEVARQSARNERAAEKMNAGNGDMGDEAENLKSEIARFKL